MSEALPSVPRKRRKSARPGEIVEAAAQSFIEHGYAGTKLDDVARRAGIAKGTIYLYFAAKQDLFEAVIRDTLEPLISGVETMVDSYDGATDILLQMVITKAYENIVKSDARHVMRIIIGEGHKFPELRELYYETSIKHGVALISRVVQRGVDRGEFRPGPATQNPRLIMAPCIMAAIWSMTFDEFAPMDIESFMAGHLDVMLNGLRA